MPAHTGCSREGREDGAGAGVSAGSAGSCAKWRRWVEGKGQDRHAQPGELPTLRLKIRATSSASSAAFAHRTLAMHHLLSCPNYQVADRSIQALILLSICSQKSVDVKAIKNTVQYNSVDINSAMHVNSVDVHSHLTSAREVGLVECCSIKQRVLVVIAQVA